VLLGRWQESGTSLKGKRRTKEQLAAAAELQETEKKRKRAAGNWKEKEKSCRKLKRKGKELQETALDMRSVREVNHENKIPCSRLTFLSKNANLHKNLILITNKVNGPSAKSASFKVGFSGGIAFVSPFLGEKQTQESKAAGSYVQSQVHVQLQGRRAVPCFACFARLALESAIWEEAASCWSAAEEEAGSKVLALLALRSLLQPASFVNV